MDRLETIMLAALESGRSPTLDEFGGMAQIVDSAESIARTSVAPEFVSLAMDNVEVVPGVGEFVADIVERVRTDVAISALVDILLQHAGRLPDTAQERCFRCWLTLAMSRSEPASARTAALRGALVLTRASPRRSLRLAAEVADTDLGDDPSFLAHAARIVGLLYAEQRHPAIPEFLEKLRRVSGAADEASFEIGMSKVAEALDAPDPGVVRPLLASAKEAFDCAVRDREARYDAKVFSLAIGLLDDFYERRPTSDMTGRIADLKREAFAYSSYVYGDEEDDFLGPRGVQVAVWSSLGIRLSRLASDLDEPVWLDGIRVIQEELLAAYTANRTLLGRSASGGVEAVVRPRIEGSILTHQAQLSALRKWLTTNGASEFAEAASHLVSVTDDMIAGRAPPDPIGR